ncbi:MAG: 23S rRNA (pseudouridine(1915)-N(3))-methyltransferase RlmH [Bdellovibrionales bacterium]|nr:23S rRNA (pseudouridine(1915)-N(3))-methyltransferase RlmH [Bdellovibrionales bacterium]
MKLVFFYLKGKTEPWAEQACEDLEKKINHFFTFERVAVKSKANDRDNAIAKTREETMALLNKFEPNDFVVLFDESGKEYKNSIDFSRAVIDCLGRQSSRIVFVIGGPYGFSDEIKKRANLQWSLSKLTMNHHVAQVVALEQLYRALTIWKGLPYHNS